MPGSTVTAPPGAGMQAHPPRVSEEVRPAATAEARTVPLALSGGGVAAVATADAVVPAEVIGARLSTEELPRPAAHLEVDPQPVLPLQLTKPAPVWETPKASRPVALSKPADTVSAPDLYSAGSLDVGSLEVCGGTEYMEAANLSVTANIALGVFTFVATAQPDGWTPSRRTASNGRGPAGTLGSVLSARFLLSLYALDAFSWGTGQVFKYEVVSLVKDREWCYLIASIILTALETVIEFVASFLTPYIYTLVQRTMVISPKGLVHFALKVYFASNLVALVIYPCFGLLIHVLGMDSVGLIILLGAVRSVQYAFGNQLGDASVEMAKPHWLATFAGTRLAFPGCCCTLLSRRATEDQLACFIILTKFLTMMAMGGVYVVVKGNVFLRWGFACTLLLWNVMAPLALLRHFEALAAAVVDGGHAESRQHSGVRSLKSLHVWELSFLLFIVVMKGVPPQSAGALMNVVLLEVPSLMQLVMVVVGGCGILGALTWKIHRMADELGDAGGDGQRTPAERRPPGTGKVSFLFQWLSPTACITFLIALGALCTMLGKWGIYLAIAIWIPTGPLTKVLDTSVDAFLFRYNQDLVSDVVYWQNVLQVLIQGPLLAINWATLESVGCTDTEGAELAAASVLLFIAAGALLLLCLYYAVVDPSLLAAKSLRAAVEGRVLGAAAYE